MKISLNWVSDYIDIEDYRSKIDELSKLLTSAGLEVEGLVDQKAQFKNVVVAKLITVGKHPDADKLTLCSVDIGSGAPTQIVCGAKNHKAGDYVIAALPGAVLPGNFEIKKSKIRGVESLGMLCSDKELGLSSESDGIRILPEGRPGQAFSEAFGLNDVIFELNVTPNRADCLSHRGLALELSALLNRPLKATDIKLKVGGFKTTDQAKVSLKDTQKCPRYAGRLVKGVKVGASPLWLKQRLESVGLRSINNVVDVTNYIMFDFGQPQHAFDWSQVQGGEIIVRTSQKGEAFKTLDGTDLTLTGEELVIADTERPVALGGVTGGLNSGVTDDTKDVFLESAFFNAQSVRRTCRRFGIDTDSSYRFTRGVNPEQTVMALEKACSLLQQVAGGEVASDWIDAYPQPITKAPITVDVKYVSERIGYEVGEKDFADVMKRLGCKVEGGKVTPPAHRWDLSIPEDLVEEYARVNGYDKLGETLPKLVEEPTKHVDEYVQGRKVGRFLVDQGFDQAVNYAFVSKALQDDVLGAPNERVALGLNGLEPINVRNPVSEDFAVMRMSLLPSMVQNVSHNLRHGNLSGQIFELGRGHYKHNGQYLEDSRLSFALWGSPTDMWGKNVPAVFRLKSAIENLLEVFGQGSKWQWKTLEAPLAFIHPSQCVQLVFQGTPIGFVGSVHPQKAKNLKWREDVAFAELNFQALFKTQKTVRFKPIPAFPGIDKDLTFVMPKTMKAAEVEREITKAASPLLSSVNVVDVYEGTGIPEDKRALSFRLSFQSPERTLADEEVLKLVQQVIDSVGQKLHLQLR
jgi:phenylalanyl-tRNA synthetase beta chain